MDLEMLNPDSVEEIFARHGASAITFTDAGDRPVLEPSPGEAPLWQDTRISGLFSPEADLAALRDDLRREPARALQLFCQHLSELKPASSCDQRCCGLNS